MTCFEDVVIVSSTTYVPSDINANVANDPFCIGQEDRRRSLRPLFEKPSSHLLRRLFHRGDRIDRSMVKWLLDCVFGIGYDEKLVKYRVMRSSTHD